MNKAELVTKMTENSEEKLTKKQMESALNAFLKTVEETLVEGDKIQIVGFGTFEAKKRAARQGRNPRKPEEIINIPASISPSFKPGKLLKEALNTNK